MSGIEAASSFCSELARHRIRYQVDVIRGDAIMISLAVPGERWEIEFYYDGTVEIERFVTTGVDECADPLAQVLEHYE